LKRLAEPGLSLLEMSFRIRTPQAERDRGKRLCRSNSTRKPWKESREAAVSNKNPISASGPCLPLARANINSSCEHRTCKLFVSIDNPAVAQQPTVDDFPLVASTRGKIQ
jgi:hypothetical protein